MSASRWSACPVCAERRAAKIDEARAKAEALYGTVPIEEYEAAKRHVADLTNTTTRAFREDWEFEDPTADGNSR